jgi:hypothetical protein
MRVPVLLLLCALSTTTLSAQDCTEGNLPDSSNEAELFRIRGTSMVFARVSSPMALQAGRLIFLMEGSMLPTIDDGTATPNFCRPGKPAENVNLLPVLPRPRMLFGLSEEMVFELSWVPPVRVQDVKANLVGVALSRSAALGVGLVSIRGHATFGEIRAPITCTEEQIARPVGETECAGGAEPSDDHYKPNSYGVEMSYGWPLGGGRFRPYFGAGVNWLRPRFQVDFTDQADVHQDQRVEGNYRRVALFGGGTWYPATRWALTGEIYADPGAAWVGRVGVAYGIK